MKSGLCPSCGAPVRFLWSGAVQTVCSYCRSILVRHDVDLEAVGKVAQLPEDPSPVRIGTEGIYRGKAFVAIGRILYKYDLGEWNEWHLLMADGSSAWLSDASLEYAISVLADPPAPLPSAEQIHRGFTLHTDAGMLQVTTLTQARYAGVEGELPFEYWGKDEIVFADMRSSQAQFATIDYTEDPPLFFLGEALDFEDIRFKNLKQLEGWS